MRKLILLFLLSLSVVAYSQQKNEISIIPEPVNLIRNTGTFEKRWARVATCAWQKSGSPVTSSIFLQSRSRSSVMQKQEAFSRSAICRESVISAMAEG